MKKQEMIQFFSSGREEMHSHSEIELIYILSGTVSIDVEGNLYRASECELMIINGGVLHGWGIDGTALFCRIQMDSYQLKQITGRDQIHISCNTMEKPDADYRKICYILDCIVKNSAEITTELVVQSLYYTLWECVKNQFLDMEAQTGIINEKNKQINHVIRDIQTRYHEQLSLQSLAEKWFLSESSLSRMVKRETGMKFVDFIRKIRMEHAREELLYTEKPIAEIAVGCGFSNPSVFHKNFKEFYRMTPSEFRTSNLVAAKNETTEDTISQLNKFLSDTKKEKKTMTEVKRIFADCNVYQEPSEAMLKCMNAGMAVDVLEQRVQKQIADMVSHLNIHYIRISNLFDWDLKIRSGHDTEQMNFDKLDAIFDFCFEIGAVPMLELPEKQKKTISSLEEYADTVQDEYRPVICTINEWERLFSAFLEHVIERYTRQNVSQWVFEIAYDIEHRTGAGQLPFEEIYLSTYQCIRHHLLDAKIGASELNAGMDEETLKQQLLWWKEREERPQFLSLMSYPYKVEQTGEGYPRLTDIESDMHFIRNEIRLYQKLLEEIEYPETPLWITEWNTSLSERNFYNDSCVKACHMLEQMTDSVGEIELMSYGIVSDWHASFYDVKTPITGGTGLVTKDGLHKPAYYAFEFWSILGNRVLKKGENYIITACEDDSIAILAFNNSFFNETYKMKEENEIQVQDLPYLFREQQPLHLSLYMKNVRDGKRKVTKYTVRESEGTILAEWKKMGFVETLNRAEIEYLEKICIPRMKNSWINTEDETLNLDITLGENEFQLILIF
ncbi:MAG: helix-turn-helix domain-containing protein [Hespellia sp.]|nr:helix-turn-helix domain-containing protein [Hespellia sp.]